jgi:hypothetical protein
MYIYNIISIVEIAVGLAKEDSLYFQKKQYLEKQGRGATSVRFPLQRSRYPSELVDFLRLLLVEPEDLGIQVSFYYFNHLDILILIIYCYYYYYYYYYYSQSNEPILMNPLHLH